jgi:phospholipid/cholesterol/gamma-HCH transport system ATP-binding protein
MRPKGRLAKNEITRYELKSFSFQYSAGNSVFENVSLDLPLNEIRHVSGPSGQGQSTLLKILALLTPPSGGEIRVNDRVVSNMTFEELLPWRIEIGYTFEGGGLLANRTLEENLALPHLYHNLADPEAIFEEIRSIAVRFEFESFLTRRPAMVSGGLRKLITILRPVLLRPSFLLMDDPFSGLAPKTAKELERLICEIRDRQEIRTIYFTSRDDIWPQRLNAKELWVGNGRVELGEELKERLFKVRPSKVGS